MILGDRAVPQRAVAAHHATATILGQVVDDQAILHRRTVLTVRPAPLAARPSEHRQVIADHTIANGAP